jgi:hypothetical protein
MDPLTENLGQAYAQRDSRVDRSRFRSSAHFRPVNPPVTLIPSADTSRSIYWPFLSRDSNDVFAASDANAVVRETY